MSGAATLNSTGQNVSGLDVISMLFSEAQSLSVGLTEMSPVTNCPLHQDCDVPVPPVKVTLPDIPPTFLVFVVLPVMESL